MEAKIKEVQNYFKSKIFNLDFKLEKVTEHEVSVIIDGKFYFSFWAGNLFHAEYRKQHPIVHSFMDLELSEVEIVNIHNLFLPFILKNQVYLKSILFKLIKNGNDKAVEKLKNNITKNAYCPRRSDEEKECLLIIDDYFEAKKQVYKKIDSLVKSENGLQELSFTIDYFDITAIVYVHCDMADATEHAAQLNDVHWIISEIKININE